MMAGTGRNQPCACGSGRKTKRCCGTTAGPSPDQLARAWLNQQARRWAPLLADYSEADLDELFDQVTHLPAHDLSLHVPLPRLLPPVLERLRHAAADEDSDAMLGAAAAALPDIDTPALRARLALAVLALHDNDHRIDCDVTAYAIIDLADNDRSVLLVAALVHAFAVTSGAARTPAGLVLATR
jgi:hypothetical protein